MANQFRSADGQDGREAVGLEPKPERRLIRHGGSLRHIDFRVVVPRAPRRQTRDRLPLSVALVIDRSGSMAGEKLVTAKRAALAVLDRLEVRDRASLVVFDTAVDVVQPAAPVSPALQARVRAALAQIEARASTALHEGWLTGCGTIAAEENAPVTGVARCLLLTDGLANVGVTDPEQIASEAAGVREHAHVSTSAFGIGADYDEALLGPLAVAGGGQFHNLRTAEEIGRAFAGELGGLLSVAAVDVRLELDAGHGVICEAVSQYWLRQQAAKALPASVALGDLLGGEERHVVLRFAFPPHDGAGECSVRARLIWHADSVSHTSEWRAVRFSYAGQAACDAEQRDAEVMHWVGLHRADRAEREATEASRRGDLSTARRTLRTVAARISQYAGSDAGLLSAVAGMSAVEDLVGHAPAAPMLAKELLAESQRRSRGQRDMR